MNHTRNFHRRRPAEPEQKLTPAALACVNRLIDLPPSAGDLRDLRAACRPLELTKALATLNAWRGLLSAPVAPGVAK